MKLITSTLISTLCWSARLASAGTAYIYTYDSEARDEVKSTGYLGDLVSNVRAKLSNAVEEVASISPIGAQLVLAQRAGVEDYHSASLTEPGVIEAINEHGLKQPLFAMDDMKRLFVLVELTEESIPTLKHAERIEIRSAPSFNTAQGFFSDLEIQHVWPERIGERLETRERAVTFDQRSDFAILKASSKAGLESVWDLILSYNAPKQRTTVTMLVFPPSALNAEGESSRWGEGYAMPATQNDLLHKRQDFPSVKMSSSRLDTRQDEGNNTTPFRGILPACFSSQSECESQTRNCTGHGSCTRSYTDNTLPEPKSCYVCSCSPTVSENSEGQRKTTYWGGPACQKRDISTQFWLIALFSVGMVSLISFAVGTLWTMGDETLPSVIGAGVSGPSARR